MSGQPSWPPFRPPKDCSQGFCSIYCPEWCYFLFPPPPGDTPFDAPGDVMTGSHSDTGPTLSPAVIVIITLVAAALLLGGYYAVVYRYRQRRRLPASAPAAAEGTVVRHPAPPDGLDESLINKITVCRYRRDVGLVGGTNCSVCLSEFREEESLRLLPKCSHAFHVQCIDTWLKSHPNCPLCRAGIIWASPPLGLPPPPESEGDPPAAGGEDADEAAMVLQDSETSLGTNEDVTKFPSDEPDDGREAAARHDVIEVGDNGVQPIRRSFSMGSSHHRIENLEGSLVSEGMSSSMARSLSWGRSSSIDHGGALPV